jgi:internalin A
VLGATLDERGLMLKHPTIQAIIHTSCLTGDGIDQLRQTITQTLTTLPHINDWIPLTWFAVKEKLAALDKDFLPYDTYIDLCLEEGITHEQAQRTLARFLHDLGIALNFQDDRRLAGTYVLNPEWVTGGIYRLLDTDHLQGKGILHLDDLDHILDRRRYPYHKHAFLLDIMGKFELCVPLGDNNRYLIPGLLPKERPPFDWPTASPEMANGAVALEYHYAILPPAVLSRLMVRLHNHIWHDVNGTPLRWRNGLILARDDCRALVVADPTPTAPRLTISLEGPFPHRRHLLASIRAELSVIHRSFARLEAEEWVPLPDHPDKAIKYQALLNLEARGRTTYYHPDHDMDLDVALLLDGVESPATRRARRMLRERGHTFNVHVGDRYDLSGDFRQSTLNLGSTMERVTQTINNKPAVSAADRASLQTLTEQLLAQLAQTPSSTEQQAEAVARQAESLLNLASSSQPAPSLIEASSRQLEQTAETAAGDMPGLPAVIKQVVALVGRMAKRR